MCFGSICLKMQTDQHGFLFILTVESSLSDPHNTHRIPLEINRRELVQVGFSSLLGIGLPSLFARQAAAKPSNLPSRVTNRDGKSVIVIFLTGAPSQLDTFDMKPEAPADIRGTFQPIATRVPGIQICEHLPLLAARTDKYAIIRSMHGFSHEHEQGTHMLLTGHNKTPSGSRRHASRRDWPCYASGLDYMRRHQTGIPTGVTLPTHLNSAADGPGGAPFCGQTAGRLGARYDPFHIKQDPNDSNFRVEIDQMPIGLTIDRLRKRRDLLNEISRQRAALIYSSEAQQFSSYQHDALSLLASGRLSQAFAIEREPEPIRDRYGRHMFGQSLLLARRLIESGVSIVQANMGYMNNWDTHIANCRDLKDRLLPPLDQAVSALLDDLHGSGLIEDTLIAMFGEFGRTPKIGAERGANGLLIGGRDHWAGAFFAVFAGGGVQGGQVIGKTDNIAAYPSGQAFHPSDLGATIYSALGAELDSTFYDIEGRQVKLNEGKVIEELYRSVN